MSTADLAERVRELHAETTAAIEAQQLLAAGARRALIEAVNEGLICRSGADGALTGWGLAALPAVWTVSVATSLTYTRLHTDATDARDDAVPTVRTVLLAVPGSRVWVSAVQVAAVEAVAGEGGHDGLRSYRITVQLRLTARVVATSPAEAAQHAQAIVGRHEPVLNGRGLVLGARTWAVTAGPDRVQPGPRLDVQPDHGRVRPSAGTGDDLAAATAARDTAAGKLSALQRNIRARAITALVDGELSGEHEQAAARVDGFLRDLGLAALPRAHHTTVVADLKLRVRATTASQARDTAWDGMKSVIAVGPDDSRPWTARGWVGSTINDLGDGAWRVTWWHAYEVWLRGHTNPAHAAGQAEAMVRTELTATPVGFDVQSMTLTHTCEGFGIDQLLDPDTD